MNPLYPSQPTVTTEDNGKPPVNTDFLTVSMPGELCEKLHAASARMGITSEELVRICVRLTTPRLLEAYELVTSEPSTLRRIAAAEFGRRRMEVQP